jgi:hypothetical protein
MSNKKVSFELADIIQTMNKQSSRLGELYLQTVFVPHQHLLAVTRDQCIAASNEAKDALAEIASGEAHEAVNKARAAEQKAKA